MRKSNEISSLELYELVSGNFKSLRKDISKTTQEDLAATLDLEGRGHISHIEAKNVKSGVSIDLLFYMAITFNFDIRNFFKGYEQFMFDNYNEQDYNNLLKLIGKNIKRVREERNISIEDFANTTGINKEVLLNLESDNIIVDISLGTLQHIAKTYNIDIKEFFN